MSDSGDREHILDAYWREYSTLRQELLSTIQSRNQVLSFGIGAVGLALGVGVFKTSIDLFWLTFLVLPLLLVAVYVLWCSEFLRMVRASQHIAILESEINQVLCGNPPYLGGVTWEIFLRSKAARNALVKRNYLPRRPAAFIKEWRHRRNEDGYWTGASMVDLHWPFSVFMSIVISGVPYVRFAAPGYVDPRVPLLVHVAILLPLVGALQAVVACTFARAKVRYSTRIDPEFLRRAVRPRVELRDDQRL